MPISALGLGDIVAQSVRNEMCVQHMNIIKGKTQNILSRNAMCVL